MQGLYSTPIIELYGFRPKIVANRLFFLDGFLNIHWPCNDTLMGAFDRMYLIETILETYFVAIQVSFVVSITMHTIYVLMRFVLVWHGFRTSQSTKKFWLSHTNIKAQGNLVYILWNIDYILSLHRSIDIHVACDTTNTVNVILAILT